MVRGSSALRGWLCFLCFVIKKIISLICFQEQLTRYRYSSKNALYPYLHIVCKIPAESFLCGKTIDLCVLKVLLHFNDNNVLFINFRVVPFDL